jgi:hypothetical protein
MACNFKNRAFKKPYTSPLQLKLMEFSTPFSEHLDENNRWVRMAHDIRWMGL